MPSKKEKTASNPQNSSSAKGDILNRSLILGSMVLMIVVLCVGWVTLNAESESPVTATPQASSSSQATTLKLNHTYQRQGAEITTDPSQVGRAGNPLSAPAR